MCYQFGELRTLILSVAPRLNNLGMRPQVQSSLGTVSLTDRALCMRMSSIHVGLDYDSMVIPLPPWIRLGLLLLYDFL